MIKKKKQKGQVSSFVKSVTVKSDLREIEKIRGFLKQALSEMPLSEEIYYMIELSLLEMCINIVRYAYPEKKGDISLKVWSQEGKIYMEVRDWGIPFDPRNAQDPDVPDMVNKGETSGLGIFLSRRLMNGFDYKREDSQNILLMYKRIDESKQSESV